MNSCPERAVLQAFHAGILSESEIDTLSSHLESCHRCVSVLDDLNSGGRGRLPLESPTVGIDRASNSAAASPQMANERYQIVKAHARGGLGEIFVAIDHELHREVALKKMHRRLATNAEASVRFAREAEVTGGLEHPGIAPVYSLGIDANGSPYYAMRFIRGQSFREAINNFHESIQQTSRRGALRSAAFSSLEFRKLLQKLVEVCNVIAYAHSRKILHRDIKPANIMLGRFGETLVVDWGLARPIGEIETPSESSLGPLVSPDGEVSLTRDGSVIGTPAYMSPEQAAGRLSEITVRSDIYSLGATLYMVLTGRPPFLDEQDIPELLKKVAHGEFAPPRRIQPCAPRRLEAICLKAMAYDPGRRYASCETLAEDLERYLADQPVTAMRDPLRARLFRWVRRHRTLVTSGVTVVCAAAVILSICIALLAKVNQDLITTNQREQQATQRAQQTYQYAKVALDNVIALKQDPRFQSGALEDVRLHLQKVESDFYEKFVALKGDDHFFQYERAKAIAQLAGMKARFDSAADSIGELNTAIEILSNNQFATRSKLPLADCYHRLGAAYQNTSKYGPAAEAYSRSIELLRTMQTQQGMAVSNHLAAVLKNLAGLHDVMGKPDEAQKLLEEAIAIREPLLAANPEDPRLQNDVASAYRELGTHYRFIGRPADAEPWLTKAVPMYEKLIHLLPSSEEFQSNLASCLIDLALVLEARSAGPEAEAAWKRSIALLESLVQDHPKTIYYTTRLATNYNHLGDHYYTFGRQDAKGIEAYLNTVRVIETSNPDADLVRLLPLLVTAHTNLASSYGRTGHATEQQEHGQSAERLLERLDDLPPPGAKSDSATQTGTRDDKAIARLYMQRAALRGRRGEWKESAEDCLRAKDHDPDDQWWWYSAGPPLILAGEIEQYKQHARDALKRFSEVEDPILAERTGKLCLLIPESVELDQAVQLIDRAVASGPEHRYHGWFKLAKSLANYRQGRLAEASNAVAEIAPVDDYRAVAFVELIAAMSNMRLRAGPLEREQLEQAISWTQSHPQSVEGGSIDWQFVEILAREAQELLKLTSEQPPQSTR